MPPTSDPVVPDPPDPGRVDPLVEVWPTDRRIVRCHRLGHAATEFNPGRGDPGRFHPLPADGGWVPTVYGSDTEDGALSETVFHDVPVKGPARRILVSRLLDRVVSTVLPLRDLSLVQLHGYGLRRLGVRRRELIETEADQYHRTVLWARALHLWPGRADGLVWVSRQHDTSRAAVLFGDRVDADRDLRQDGMSLPLGWGSGLERVLVAAEAAGITVVR
jgi:hypothetical protein